MIALACSSEKDDEEKTEEPHLRTRDPDKDDDGIPDTDDQCPTEAAPNTSDGCLHGTTMPEPTLPENGVPTPDAERDAGVPDAAREIEPDEGSDIGESDDGGKKPDRGPRVDEGVDATVRDMEPPVEDGGRADVANSDGGMDRRGINDHYADLVFCSGRNIFMMGEDEMIGACGDKPARLYRVPIHDDIFEPVAAEPILELPEEVEGRDVLPVNIRSSADPNIVVLPMMHPDPGSDTAATALFIDKVAGSIVEPVIDATALQIVTEGIDVPISGLQDLSWFQGAAQYVGVLSRPDIAEGDEERTYRFGIGFMSPSAESGLLDTGVEPSEGVMERILSENPRVEQNRHFSFGTSTNRPTQVFSLGAGPAGEELIGIQNSGAGDSYASIDIFSSRRRSIVRTVFLGDHYLRGVAPAVDVEAMKVYAVGEDGTSLFEVDVSERGAPIQENEIFLQQVLQESDIASVTLWNQFLIVGTTSGNLLFLGRDGERRGRVERAISVGDRLHQVSIHPMTGHLFAAVEVDTPEGFVSSIVAVQPNVQVQVR